MSAKGCDFQNQDYNYIVNDKSLLPHPRGSWVEDTNLLEICMYFAVRHAIPQNWKNNQDQFFAPLNTDFDEDFIKDCFVYTLFSEKNKIQSQNGINHWIPFEEKEVGAKDVYESHFMTEYISGKKRANKNVPTNLNLFQQSTNDILSLRETPLSFSSDAKSVMEAGKKIWIYYHQQSNANPNASFYDIRLHFQGYTIDAKGRKNMNNNSKDPIYNALLADLKDKMFILERQIERKVYEYGFLLN